jgi:transposase
VPLGLAGAEAARRPRLPVVFAGVAADAALVDTGYEPGAGQPGRDSVARGGAMRSTPRKNRLEQRRYGRHLYMGRNAVGRQHERVKPFRRVATRYHLLPKSYLG